MNDDSNVGPLIFGEATSFGQLRAYAKRE